MDSRRVKIDALQAEFLSELVLISDQITNIKDVAIPDVLNQLNGAVDREMKVISQAVIKNISDEFEKQRNFQKPSPRLSNREKSERILRTLDEKIEGTDVVKPSDRGFNVAHIFITVVITMQSMYIFNSFSFFDYTNIFIKIMFILITFFAGFFFRNEYYIYQENKLK